MRRSTYTSFEDLVAGHYGDKAGGEKGRGRSRGPASMEDLLDGYYGAATPPPPPKPKPAVAASLSLRANDPHEVLPQRLRGRVPAQSTARARPFSSDAAAPPERPNESPWPADPPILDENGVDLAAPAPIQPPEYKAPEIKAPEYKPPPIPSAPEAPPFAIPEPPSAPVGPTGAAPMSYERRSSSSDGEERGPDGATEAEFMADMQAILSGQKSYDPLNKKMVDRHGVNPPPEAASNPVPPPPSQPPPNVSGPPEAHDIFQRIAQSMEYAGGYDLGSVDLENRFASFDQADEAKRTKKPQHAKSPRPPSPGGPGAIAGTGGIPDLGDLLGQADAVRRQATPPPGAVHGGVDTGGEDFFPDFDNLPGVSRPSSLTPPSYAQPFYGTGEHVRTGGALYVNQLNVGQTPGVNFSYGEIIAMADLFASVDQMQAASVDELQAVRTEVQRSLTHYSPGPMPRPEDPDTKDWGRVTGGRYLRLAEDNYNHFAPNVLFRSEAYASSASRHGDHKSAWESHHLRAIREVQAMNLGPGDALRTNWPLVINAFGDHFLTDAFAAGHIFNKAAISGLFKANFYTGGKLTGAGEAFMKTVASKAFRGPLADKFSVLETYEPYLLWWNPNINSASRFADLLIGIANAEPEKIANLAVKVLHDKLNKGGIEVTNGLGAKPWLLTGDDHLTTTSLGYMQAAVQASVANILDPAIRVAGFVPGPHLAKVWAHVPVLTAASADWLRKLAPTLIHPGSGELADAASNLLFKEVDELIKELLDRKILQKA
jgi:hypothetical protein